MVVGVDFFTMVHLVTPAPLDQILHSEVRKNKAGYTAGQVACSWAGAVTPKPPVNVEKAKCH